MNRGNFPPEKVNGKLADWQMESPNCGREK
jgi:hypothetical protein